MRNPLLVAMILLASASVTFVPQHSATAASITVKNTDLASLETRAAALLKKLPTTATSLTALVKEAQAGLQTLTSDQEVAAFNVKDSEVAHTPDYNPILEKLVYVERMLSTPQTLDTIDGYLKTIDDKKGAEKKAKKDLEKIASTMRKRSGEIRKTYDKGDYSGAAAIISQTRAELLESLMKTKKTVTDETLKRNLTSLGQTLAIELATTPNTSDEVMGLPPVRFAGVNVLVCMMKWNAGDPNIDQSALETVMNDVVDWYDETSYHNANINVFFAGNNLWNGSPVETFTEETAAAVETCDGTIDFSMIDVVIVYPSSLRAPRSGWGSPVPVSVITDEGQRSLKHLHLGSNGFMQRLVEHELGHVFGVNHANSLDCGVNAFSATYERASSGCAVREYGNYYSAMGYSGIVTNYGGHFTGWHKYLLGWTPDNTVRADGSYTLKAVEDTASGNKFMRVPFTSHPICIEYRKPSVKETGLWNNIFGFLSPAEQTAINSNSMMNNGCVFVSVCEGGTNHTIAATDILIDAHPNTLPGTFHSTNRSEDPIDSCVKNGESFANIDAGVNFSVVTGAADATITLDLDESKL